MHVDTTGGLLLPRHETTGVLVVRSAQTSPSLCEHGTKGTHAQGLLRAPQHMLIRSFHTNKKHIEPCNNSNLTPKNKED